MCKKLLDLDILPGLPGNQLPFRYNGHVGYNVGYFQLLNLRSSLKC